jgi:hypothetical protein
MQTDIPPVRFTVEKILPHGLAILASPPKYGKSWFVLDLCLSVSLGEPFLGIKTNKCDTLYLALEDSQNRLKTRIAKLQPPSYPENFVATLTASELGDGLIDGLSKFLDAAPNTRLVVIDTLQKIRGQIARGENPYAQDYRELGMIKRFADERDICILLVHHTRKSRDERDIFNQISGTNGIAGSVDTMLLFERDMRKGETTMHVTGRDIEMDEIKLEMVDGKWSRRDTIVTPSLVTPESALYKTLKVLNPFSGSMAELSEAIEKQTGIKIIPNKIPQMVKTLEIPYIYKRKNYKKIYSFNIGVTSDGVTTGVDNM